MVMLGLYLYFKLNYNTKDNIENNKNPYYVNAPVFSINKNKTSWISKDYFNEATRRNLLSEYTPKIDDRTSIIGALFLEEK